MRVLDEFDRVESPGDGLLQVVLRGAHGVEVRVGGAGGHDDSLMHACVSHDCESAEPVGDHRQRSRLRRMSPKASTAALVNGISTRQGPWSSTDSIVRTVVAKGYLSLGPRPA